MCHPLLLWHLEKRGVRTGAWVINHAHEYEKADPYGFGGIMTDFPSRFVEYERERKKIGGVVVRIPAYYAGGGGSIPISTNPRNYTI